MLRWFRTAGLWMVVSFTALTVVAQELGNIDSWGQTGVDSTRSTSSDNSDDRDVIFWDMDRGIIASLPNGFAPTDWSADGLKVAGGKDGDIYMLSLTDFQIKNLTQSTDYNEYLPQWSRDGRRLAFSVSVPSNDSSIHQLIGILDTETGERIYQPLDEGVMFASMLIRWSADSQMFAYMKQIGQPSHMEIEVVKIDNGRLVTQFVYSEHSPENPNWSPDGKWMTFETRETKYTTENGFTSSKPVWQIWLVDTKSGEARPIIEGQGNGPAWSPDSQQIAYTVWQHYENNPYRVLMVMDITSGEVHQLTSLPQSVSQPSWSPDGHWIATIAYQNQTQTVNLIDAINGEQLQLVVVEGTPSPSIMLAPKWSPDGRWLSVFTDYYLNNTSSVPRTYIVDVESRSLPYNCLEYRSGFLWRP